MSFPDIHIDGSPRGAATPSLADLCAAQWALCLTPWAWMSAWWEPWPPAVAPAPESPPVSGSPAVIEVVPVVVTTADADDLTRIEGIGPKIAAKLVEAGVTTFAALAATPVERLEAVIAAAGARFKLARPESWPEQAALLAAGDEQGFAALTAELRGGVRR